MNVFTFSGNLGKDAEMRTTPTGTVIGGFSVAVKAGYGDKEHTNWVKCSLFGKRAESLQQYLVKGQQVVISGEYDLNEWEKDGVKHSMASVKVNELTLVGGKPASQNQAPQQSNQAPANASPQPAGLDSFDDDLPF